MTKPDVVIIGSGVLGCSVALSLLQSDSNINVLLIGDNNKKGSATQAAGAMLGAYGEVTETLLKSSYGQVKFKCGLEAKSLWQSWLNLVNEKSNRRISITKGTFIVHNATSGTIDTKNFRAIKKALTDQNEEFQEVNFEDIPGVDTLENMRSLQSIYIPNEGSICAAEYLEALQFALQTYSNFNFLQGQVSALQLEKEKITSIELVNGDKIEAPLIILAAGAFSQKLIDQLPPLKNRIPRILAGVGHSLLMTQSKSPIKHIIRTPNRAGACGLHVLPYKDHLYVGATNELKIFPEADMTMGWVHFLLQCALDQINQHLFSEKILEISVGNRPSPLDGFPLIGRTSLDNLFLLTGTYRDGFHQSPYLAHVATQNILYDKPILDGMFNPERKPIVTMSRDEAREEAIEHHMATAYEAGARLPHSFWTDSMKRHMRNDINAFYELFGTSVNLLPEQVLMLRDVYPDGQLIDYFKDYFLQLAH